MTFFVPFGNQASREQTVPVTGATGVAGTVLLQLRRHRLVALTYRRSARGNVITAHGRATRLGLGLPVDRYRALARHVDVVVPAVAETDLLARSGKQPSRNRSITIRDGVPDNHNAAVASSGAGRLTGNGGTVAG